ncbi:MAG TPA: lipopolysaccharide biosynthesis protein [Candidatus Sulfotelmatobacter sp.]|nr:lipopolysaccharide biosynthesis protein [Candidatus Sulfotelmatobacter sp.]
MSEASTFDGDGTAADDRGLQDLKRRTARGAVVSTAAQAGTVALRMASLMILARLLAKEDFGLVNMVTAVIGMLGLLRDGLSAATVQRMSVTGAQTSTFFWINLAVGGLLGLVTALTAPLLVSFYGEPRLFWVTVALGTILLFNGAAGQHRAMLQRGMRFTALAAVDLAALFSSIAVGIGLAMAGFRYWSLVGMAIAQPLVGGIGVWLATGWLPGLPRRRSGVRSMVAYGGAVTVSNLLAYLAFNADKVLIGRFWGAAALGIYGRAYQLVSLPNDNLHSTIGSVAFPALARVQDDPGRLKAYFLRGYGLFLSLVVPITMGCALFADDIVLVFLGSKWHDATPIFRLLAPTILAFAFTNPFAWLILASGRAGRSARIALAVTPVLILGYLLGLPHGPAGVAAGYSASMAVCVVPVLLWARRGTLITMMDIFRTARPALVSVVTGVAVTLAIRPLVDRIQPGFWRLVLESSALFGGYFLTLVFVMNQKSVYMGLLREIGFLPAPRWRAAGGKA